ncbi:hypothetical protein F9B85_12005 [Heliorestis acidaminivorans]|uniref:Uncharacterized protein n=1 Tax=Heliorestis acidaminivorans TaxID=553427 RepID=A0A6I0F0A9_9FIRM|nr:hypothetical protein [Heliorestis acidaminivorans]KAB2951523.1 hypothetical protein F9B85_12005 [Heliorestis acidaminivorans]
MSTHDYNHRVKERLKYFVAPGQHLDFSYRTVDVGAMKYEEILERSNPKLYALLPVVDREYYQDKPEEHLKKSADVRVLLNAFRLFFIFHQLEQPLPKATLFKTVAL